jgi:hypothetical protein
MMSAYGMVGGFGRVSVWVCDRMDGWFQLGGWINGQMKGAFTVGHYILMWSPNKK